MAIDFKEFQEQARLRRAKASSDRVAMLAAEREAVAAENLTGNEYWDRYLSYLQAAISRMALAADHVAAAILHPMSVNRDFLIVQKTLHAQLRAQIEILSDAMRLPAEIMKAGKDARDLLAKYGEIIQVENGKPDDAA